MPQNDRTKPECVILSASEVSHKHRVGRRVQVCGRAVFAIVFISFYGFILAYLKVQKGAKGRERQK